MRRSLVGLLLVGALAACMPPAGTLFRVTLISPDGDFPLPVALGDQTGLVSGIQDAAGDPMDPMTDVAPSIMVDPKDPKAFILRWLGGACDNDAALAFYPTATGYALDVTTHGKIVLGCTSQGINRVVRIGTSTPVDLATIRVTSKT